jgi:hypothetical protein
MADEREQGLGIVRLRMPSGRRGFVLQTHPAQPSRLGIPSFALRLGNLGRDLVCKSESIATLGFVMDYLIEKLLYPVADANARSARPKGGI